MAGTYLYGFTGRGFVPPAGLCGLRGAPVRAVGFAEIAAVISDHPVQRLMPSRSNIEPHHRVVRDVATRTTLVPMAFGHVTDNADDIVEVLRANCSDIRRELARLAGTCEMTVKMTWKVANIFDHLVRTNRELRDARDRVFRGGRDPAMNDKLQVGATFEATLTSERERMSAAMLAAMRHVTGDSVLTPARDEKTICHAALLVERSRMAEFEAGLRHLATLFDASVGIDYSGPWPTYSFVSLRLRPSETPAAA
jgi:hypothetical protein